VQPEILNKGVLKKQAEVTNFTALKKRFASYSLEFYCYNLFEQE